MKKQLFVNQIEVKKSNKHGYGVFAKRSFKKGTILEECYMIVTRGGDKGLEDYYFDVKGKHGIFTGFGIIYNHAEEPNVDYHIYTKRKLVVFKANRNIKKGEELTISYGDGWFDDRGAKFK